MSHSETISVNGYPLSSHQRRLWLRPDHPALCSQIVVLVEGRCESNLTRAAMRRIVDRHEVLRTTFHDVPSMKMPLQVPGGVREFSWEEFHIDGEKALDGLCAQERKREFELEHGPVLRVLFVPVRENSFYLVFTVSALCGDPGTLQNLVRELADEYGASEPQDSEVVQYVQFSEWHHSLLQEEDAPEGCEYWREQARKQAAQGLLRFPFEPGRIENSGTATETLRIYLPSAIGAKISSLAAENSASPETVLFACWSALLSRMSAQPVQFCWVTLSGRDHEMLADVSGLLATPVPVQWDFERPSAFSHVIVRTHEALSEASEWHAFYRPEHFEEQICPGIRIGFEFNENTVASGEDGIRFSVVRSFFCAEELDLKLAVSAGETSYSLQFHYNPLRFSGEFVRDLAARMKIFLGHVQGRKLPDEIEILPETEWRRLII